MRGATLCALFLVGCAYQTAALPPAMPGEEPMKPSKTVASSGSNERGIAWQCRQEDFNDNLIWIECQFQNTSNAPGRACLQAILSDDQQNEVSRSHVICSGMMAPGGTYENNIAFENTKQSRRRTQIAEKCSLDTSW